MYSLYKKSLNPINIYIQCSKIFHPESWDTLGTLRKLARNWWIQKLACSYGFSIITMSCFIGQCLMSNSYFDCWWLLRALGTCNLDNVRSLSVFLLSADCFHQLRNECITNYVDIPLYFISCSIRATEVYIFPYGPANKVNKAFSTLLKCKVLLK